MKLRLLCLLLLMLAANYSFSQTTPEEEEDEALLMPVEQINRFNIIFQRGIFLMSPSTKPEFAPLKNSTGSWFVGLGFKFPIARNRLGLRLSPGFTWLKFNYATGDSLKIFPDTILTHTFQRHRFTYIDLPIGIYYNITLDEDRATRFYVEGGGFISFNTATVHKFGDEPRTTDEGFDLRKTKEIGISDPVEQFRYGLYARAGYRWVGLHFSYRLTNIFSGGSSPCNDQSAIPPCLPEMQLGLTIML